MSKEENPYKFDEVKLYEVPFGTIITVTKEVLEENVGFDSFDINKKSYDFIIFNREEVGEDSIAGRSLDKDVTIYFPVGMRRDKEFVVSKDYNRSDLDVVNELLTILIKEYVNSVIEGLEDTSISLSKIVKFVQLKEVIKDI